MANPIRVLHVDDEPTFADLVATFLEREDDQFTVETATGAEEGLAHLTDHDVDCIVSDYDMPERNGIEFLESVREEYDELPFILHTGKGNEEIASDAISAGVTDYLQKKPGTEQYQLLANRIRNAVEQYRAVRQAVNLDRFRDLTSDIKQALIRATSRAEMEANVCEIFSDSEPYLFAWIGELDPETNRVTPRVSAGVGEDDLEAITVTADGSPTGRGPLGTAICERRVVVTQNVQTDSTFEPWREQALERGFQAAAAVPLVYEEVLYGQLVVYAEHVDAFDADERALLAELGDDIAHAIHSLEIRSCLREERDRRDVLFANNLSPIMEFTFEDRTPIIKAVNNAFEAEFGYDSAAIVGQPVADHIIPEQANDEFQETKRCVLSREPVEAEVRRKTTSGVRDFVCRVIPYTGNGSGDSSDGFPVGGYAWYTDVTESRERERELERYETIIEALGDPVYALDADGHFTFVNDAFVQNVGYSRSDILGEHVSEIVPEAHHRQGRAVVQDLLADSERRSATWELDRIAADTDRVPTENHVALLPTEDGEFRGTAGIFRDISERKKHERRLQAITEATTREAIYLKDTEGRYQFINEAGARVFDREPEEVLGKRAAELYDSVERDQLEVDEQVLQKGVPVQYEVTRTVDGNEYHFLAEKHPYYEEGELFGLVGTSRDITERKEYEWEIRRQNERLDEFASIVAHDLRNPLNIAQGRVELAQAECDSQHLSEVARAHDRMEALISDLLTLAREGQTVTATEPVDLAEIAERCWWNVETDTAQLVTDTDITIRADPGRLQQLLENLIHNAITHGGDAVTITIGELADGSGFYVADDGSGIPIDERGKVFELGYSSTANGTGFGLSIVEQIVEAHGWDVRLTEGDDGGARFEVTGIDVD